MPESHSASMSKAFEDVLKTVDVPAQKACHCDEHVSVSLNMFHDNRVNSDCSTIVLLVFILPLLTQKRMCV